jgi:hypothetical protein
MVNPSFVITFVTDSPHKRKKIRLKLKKKSERLLGVRSSEQRAQMGGRKKMEKNLSRKTIK